MVERRPATQRTRVHLKQTLFTQRANLENMKRITNPPTFRFEIIILGWQKCAAVDCSFGKNEVGFERAVWWSRANFSGVISFLSVSLKQSFV